MDLFNENGLKGKIWAFKAIGYKCLGFGTLIGCFLLLCGIKSSYDTVKKVWDENLSIKSGLIHLSYCRAFGLDLDQQCCSLSPLLFLLDGCGASCELNNFHLILFQYPYLILRHGIHFVQKAKEYAVVARKQAEANQTDESDN